MKRLAILGVFGLLSCCLIVAAVKKPVPPKPNYLVSDAGNGYVCVVQAVTDNIIRVSYAKNGEAVPEPKLVLSTADVPHCYVNGNDNGYVLLTPSGISVGVNEGKVSIFAGDNRVVTNSGIPEIVDGKQVLKLKLNDDAPLYGAGERGHSFNLLGDTLVMYNRQNYSYTEGDPRTSQMGITMPLIISKNGFALLFDDYAASSLYTGNPIEYKSENTSDLISFYFINSPEKCHSLASVVTELSKITGRQQLPPLWSLGYITSKYGYRTQKETLGVIDTLQRKGYPVDGVVLDLYWYGKEQDMGSLSWKKSQWPDHKKMLSTLKKKGVNLVAISQPYVLKNGRGVENYNELSPRGMFCTDSLGKTHDVTIWVGTGGMFDVSNPETYSWLYNRYKLLTDEGITGWWGDLGEPEVHPETIFHKNGLSARLYHNVYGNDWSKIIADMFAKEYPDTRLMTMMRGGTIGLQRYNVFPWSTDVSRSWGGLQPQIKIMLNSGISGMGYMSHDVGGFAIDREHPVDAELYVRWLQLGVFSPILRTHASQASEPYKYPDYQSIILPLIKARYQWLPYNYTLSYENAAMGLPLVRPLNFYSSADCRDYSDITDEYLWGRDVLVAPVLNPGVSERKVIIPDGKWFDMSNPSMAYSNDTISYPVKLETLPMFVRAGAFIAKADYKMKNVGDYKISHYDVSYYPAEGVKGSSFVYEDDLTSPSHFGEKNEQKYNLVRFTGAENSIVISTEKFNGGIDSSKTISFTVFGVNPPKVVSANGKALKYKYSNAERKLVFTVNYITSEDLKIEY